MLRDLYPLPPLSQKQELNHVTYYYYYFVDQKQTLCYYKGTVAYISPPYPTQARAFTWHNGIEAMGRYYKHTQQPLQFKKTKEANNSKFIKKNGGKKLKPKNIARLQDQAYKSENS